VSYPPDFEQPPASPSPPPPGYIRIPLSQPIVTYILLSINAIIWLIVFLGDSPSSLLQYGANTGVGVLRGETWRLFTSMFLHSRLDHFFFNAFALFVLGIEMEQIYNPPRFAIIYILSGLFGSFLGFAGRGPDGASIGASGAIFGVIGMNLAYFLLHRESFGVFGRQRVTSTLVIIGINLILGFTIPGIDNLAHIGGLIAGLALGYAMAPRYQIVNQYTFNPHLVDMSTLAKRWWAPALGVLLLIAGVQLATSFWLNRLGGF
jgi:rhomboid protease GluP